MIGVVSDIHGNKIALDRVLEDMPEVDTLICLGDIIGYGPQPRECLELIREEADVFVQGNHDRNIDSPEVYAGSSAYAGLKHAQKELDDYQFTWLRRLPYQVNSNEFVVVHSHPEKLDHHTYPDGYHTLTQYIDDSMDGLLLGHTHVQSEKRIDGKVILNPGSVGQPRDKNKKAAYAVINENSLQTELRRVNYDIDTVAEQIHEADLPEDAANRLYDGV